MMSLYVTDTKLMEGFFDTEYFISGFKNFKPLWRGLGKSHIFYLPSEKTWKLESLYAKEKVSCTSFFNRYIQGVPRNMKCIFHNFLSFFDTQASTIKKNIIWQSYYSERFQSEIYLSIRFFDKLK